MAPSGLLNSCEASAVKRMTWAWNDARRSRRPLMVPASSSSSSPAPVRGSRSERFPGSSLRAVAMLSATGLRACRERNRPPTTARTRDATGPPGDEPVEFGQGRLRLRQRDAQFQRKAIGPGGGDEHPITRPRVQGADGPGPPGRDGSSRQEPGDLRIGGDGSPAPLADDDDQALPFVGHDLSEDLGIEGRPAALRIVGHPRRGVRPPCVGGTRRSSPRARDPGRNGPRRKRRPARRPGPGSSTGPASSASRGAYSSRRT